VTAQPEVSLPAFPRPYWSSGDVTLYHGDMREVLPALGVKADLIMADPPYQSTSLDWDRWPDGWLEVAAQVSRSMWCFLPLRQFAEPPYRGIEFREAGWRLSQDLESEHDHLVWEKHNGSNFHNDRFKRVHEIAGYWYQGDWGSSYRNVPVTLDAAPRTVRRKGRPPHLGKIGDGSYVSEDGGPRLMRSVIRVRSMHGKAINETEKPPGLLEPMITYGCPPGGLVVVPFAGSCSDLDVARWLGRRVIGVEKREQQCERAAKRLDQGCLSGGAA
jgi:site-specific DNA-methyltransferase (adenine-specific)